MESVTLFVVGLAIVGVVVLDFLLTTISLRAQGPATRLVTAISQWIVGFGGTRLGRYGGPITLSSLAGFWIVGMWTGWSIAFHAARSGLAGPSARPDVGFWDAVGFAGATLSTLGMGVVTPAEPWLHVLTVLTSVFGMLVLTLSVTYVLNVNGIAVASRSLALGLRDVTHILAAARTDRELAEDVAERASPMRAALHEIADRRDAFPLAKLYEVEGSERDIAMRAEMMAEAVRPALDAAPHPRAAAEIALLMEALGRLTRSD